MSELVGQLIHLVQVLYVGERSRGVPLEEEKQ